MSVLSPCPNESMSFVNRAISSEEPWSEKLARSRLIDRRKNMLRMSKRVNCITSATSTSWRNMKKPFRATPSMTSPIKQHQRLEAFVRQIFVDIRLCQLAAIQQFLFVGRLVLDLAQAD